MEYIRLPERDISVRRYLPVDTLNAKCVDLIQKYEFRGEISIDFEAEIIMQEVMFRGPDSKRTKTW